MIGSKPTEETIFGRRDTHRYSNKLETADDGVANGSHGDKSVITLLDSDCLIQNQEITLLSDDKAEEASSNADLTDVTHVKLCDTHSPSYTRKNTKERNSGGGGDCDTKTNSAVIFVGQQNLPSSELQSPQESDASIIHISNVQNSEDEYVLSPSPSYSPATRQQGSRYCNKYLRSRPPPSDLIESGVRLRRQSNTGPRSSLITDFYPSPTSTITSDLRNSLNSSSSDSAVAEEGCISLLPSTSRLTSNNSNSVGIRSSGVATPTYTPSLLDALPMSSQEQRPRRISRNVNSTSRNAGGRYNTASFRRSGRRSEPNRSTQSPTSSGAVEVPPFVLYSRTLQIQESRNRLGRGGEFPSAMHPLYERNFQSSASSSRLRETQNGQGQMSPSIYTINANGILQLEEVTDTVQSGLSPAQISTLAFSTVCLITRDDSPDCSVCMSPLDVDNMVYDIPCKHVFHIQCLTDWLTRKNSCPICRCKVIATGDQVMHCQNNGCPTSLNTQLQGL